MRYRNRRVIRPPSDAHCLPIKEKRRTSGWLVGTVRDSLRSVSALSDWSPHYLVGLHASDREPLPRPETMARMPGENR
jgi:hypothetical protein